jgi:exodeoxyribonuclease V gamma subunit
LIYLYPANKMENLLVLLDKIQQISPLPVFSQEYIVVQNAGMQHWLNLSLAKQRGISMNMQYTLPAQFLWKLARSLASDDEVPEQSPYSREVLTWRICGLLVSDLVCADSDFEQATQYWQSEKTAAKGALKRYQLACQLADLYEQYLIFRPEWIDAWQRGEIGVDAQQQTALHQLAHWQAKLWQLLNAQHPYNPMQLMKLAIDNIADKKQQLPTRISFFGINAMAPMWLAFIHALSEHIQVHFFHLNPCYAYWGDIVTEKQSLRALSAWVDGYDDIRAEVGNPLLANLGQQGREFMALLQQFSTINIEAFERAELQDMGAEQQASGDKLSVLAHCQNDILTLSDARQTPQVLIDDSITITSCHSAFREVQGLHDWLLHKFNQTPELTPKDVLVMCPQIENYAPYINAVFTRGWQDLDGKIPPLPCSIADRSSKDTEPVIAAFSDLLSLPDSRFQVSQLIALLRLPAMQLKFDICIEEIDKITHWLGQAAIHWGLDAAHKQQVLNIADASDSFTWQQGLSRLLLGFAYGDQPEIYQQHLLLPCVEGDDAILLGKLMLIIEQLQTFATTMALPRDAVSWQTLLMTLVDDLFDTQADNNFTLIYQAIESLVEYCTHAQYVDKIELEVIREFLNNHFSQPDPGRQFMIGQVTFCSMVPMRSIPFKIIAVLGLNDGEYPRQRQPLGFDLMDLSPAKLGDRSRRGDDRYLFLEAIISARLALYLSFQGKNIVNNKEKQSSLLLKEFMEYLSLGYGWRLQDNDQADVRALAMQPFSEKNYVGEYASFDHKWLKHHQNRQQSQTDKNASRQSALVIDRPVIADEQAISIEAIALERFYQHPAKYFARNQLDLYFEQNSVTLDDAEPFVSDRLETYLLRQQLVAGHLQDESEITAEPLVDMALDRARLGGKFPQLPSMRASYDKWQQDSEMFGQEIIEQLGDQPVMLDCQLELELGAGTSITIMTKMPVQQQQLVFYRSSSAKPKDLFTLYLHQLIVQVWQQQYLSDSSSKDPQTLANELKLSQVSDCMGLYFETKTQKIKRYSFSNLTQAKEQLITLIDGYFAGQRQALLLNGDIAQFYFKASAKGKSVEQADFAKFWQDDNKQFALGDDAYMRYFWPQCPEISEHSEALEQIYQQMYQVMEQQNL